MLIELDGRQFEFGDNADPDEARRLVQEFLEAEKELAEAQAADADDAQLKRNLAFVEGDLRAYQEWSSGRWPALRDEAEPEPVDALTPGERAIVAELRELRRAVLSDRVMVPDEIGEYTRSKVVLPEEEKQ